MNQEERKAWHPWACSAIEIDLRKYKKYLRFDREVQLNKEPLRMDLLIIKKDPEVVIDNDIARIFASYNIVEYKSPEDSLTIDDFYKVLCYACYYKSQGQRVDERHEDDITLSLIRESYPVKLIQRLREKCSVREATQGVYYVEGLLFKCQIVVTAQLDRTHPSLRILSRNIQREDLGLFLGQAGNFDKEDIENADSILEICTATNYDLFHSVKKEEHDMCEAMRRLMADELAESRMTGREEGREEGIIEGEMKTMVKLVRQGILSVKVASEMTRMTEQEFALLLAKK